MEEPVSLRSGHGTHTGFETYMTHAKEYIHNAYVAEIHEHKNIPVY